MRYTKHPGIYGFTGPHRWLSNFYIEPDGTHVEGEYQRAKCAEAHQRALFEPNTCTTPFHPPRICKGLGNQVKLKANWEELDPKTGLLVKMAVMQFYVRKKFRDHPSLAEKLKETGTLRLVEENYWHDTFWGTYQGNGLNTLGELLMEVRAEL